MVRQLTEGERYCSSFVVYFGVAIARGGVRQYLCDGVIYAAARKIEWYEAASEASIEGLPVFFTAVMLCIDGASSPHSSSCVVINFAAEESSASTKRSTADRACWSIYRAAIARSKSVESQGIPSVPAAKLCTDAASFLNSPLYTTGINHVLQKLESGVSIHGTTKRAKIGRGALCLSGTGLWRGKYIKRG